MLDTILAAAARRAGAQVRPGVTVTGVRRDGAGRVVGVTGHDRAGAPVDLDARWVVGADGLRSRVARSVGAPVTEVRPAGGAAQYAYYERHPVERHRVLRRRAVVRRGVPDPRRAGVHLGLHSLGRRQGGPPPDRVPRGGVRRAAGALGAASWPSGCVHARRTSPVEGMLRQPNQLRQAFGPGWALVGDAGYYRDAVTAYGISDAFRDAELLAVAFDRALAGDADEEAAALAAYQQRARPGAAGDLRDHLPPGGLPAGADVRRAAEAAGRRHRQAGGGAGRPADPRRAPARDRLTGRRRPGPRLPIPTRLTRQPAPRRRTKMTTTTRSTTRCATAWTPPPCSPPSTPSSRRPRPPSSSSAPTTSGRAAPTTAAPSRDYFGVGEERTHERTFVFDADHPAVLVGPDNGPTPVEFVLHALAACLTAGLANIAAARGVRLTEVRSTVTGDIDLNGILGLDPEVRNGYQQITVRFTDQGRRPGREAARAPGAVPCPLGGL